MADSRELHELPCEACKSDSLPVDDDQARAFLNQLPEWEITRQGDSDCLARQFEFRDFREAFEFAGRVAELAEQENHHPLIQIEWGKAAVRWWTHSINGLHLNDFILAARTDRLVKT